jgi:hypothetical protein
MNRDELERFVGITGYSLGQVEKDYLQHIVLSVISRKCAGILVFKGGTALQKTGFVKRFSDDLDFTAKRGVHIDSFKDMIVESIGDYNYASDAGSIVNDEQRAGFRLKIQGPLYRNFRSVCTIRIELSRRELVLLKPESREFTPGYPDVLPYIMDVMKAEEILAEKIRALYTRQKARDMYDIYMLLEKNTVLDIALINEKLKLADMKFDSRIFKNRCISLRTMWQNELKSIVLTVPSFDDVNGRIGEALRKVKNVVRNGRSEGGPVGVY